MSQLWGMKNYQTRRSKRHINRYTTHKTNILSVTYGMNNPTSTHKQQGLKECMSINEKKSPARKSYRIILNPNCLKMDKAIILFKSYSKLAPRPSINIVKPEINKKNIFNQYPKEGLNRINK
jgi:hypothetical protein